MSVLSLFVLKKLIQHDEKKLPKCASPTQYIGGIVANQPLKIGSC